MITMVTSMVCVLNYNKKIKLKKKQTSREYTIFLK